MKSLLLMSIVLNAVLGFKLYLNSKKPALERIVVEEKIIEKEVPVVGSLKPSLKVPDDKSAVKDNKDQEPQPMAYSHAPMNEAEWQDEIEKVEVAKQRFFEKENIDPVVLDKAGKIKLAFQKKQQALFKDVYPGELPIEKRRQQIDLEEKYQKDMQALFGKSKWEKFEAFRNRYNQSIYKKLSGPDATPGPFVPMDI